MPILTATEKKLPSKKTTKIDEIIARGYEKKIVFWAILLPTNLTVRSVATTTRGKISAPHVILKS